MTGQTCEQKFITYYINKDKNILYSILYNMNIIHIM